MASQFKRRHSARITLLIITLLPLETIVQRWIEKGTPRLTENIEPSRQVYKLHVKRPKKFTHSKEYAAHYAISDEVKNEYEKWHALVWNMSQIRIQPTNWTPAIHDWNDHTRNRSHRFPSVDERVRYYMGRWYDTTVPMYGRRFEEATFIQRRTTREFGPYSNVLVNLYDLDKGELTKCHERKGKLKVFSPYCRDYTDIAILHSEGSANVLHYIGDGLPYIPEEIREYPLFAKVRSLCDVDASESKKSSSFRRRDDVVEPILLPLNRKRHYGVASIVPENDIPWEQKEGRAVWRGKYGASKKTNDEIKFALVSKHLHSSLVNAKFSELSKGAPKRMLGSYMDMKNQLTYKYIISIEGNDVSSGLKWMLLSNSVVLMPPCTMESWAMEGKLKPFVHFIPLRADMSNVEEMVRWAESHPKETRLISERSTLFVYDAFFHPDAIEDEERIMVRIMERYEQNFGHDAGMRRNSAFRTQSNKHPQERALRFPSVEERVKYLMGKWYHNENEISMLRSKLPIISHSSLNVNISKDSLFIASGRHLSACAMANSTYSKDIRLLCQSSLQHFDERNTADLKSSSLNRLLQSNIGAKIRFASESSWRHDEGNANKRSNRVILDDTIKIICTGDCSGEGVKLPYFASYRRNNDAILWPFNVDYDYAYGISKYGLLQKLDVDFEVKAPTAVVICRIRSSEPKNLMLKKTADAAFAGVRMMFFSVNESSSKKENQIHDMLSYRYLVVDTADGITQDLVWMLLSKSVVLMPEEQRAVSSWLMESTLEPYLHFVPVASDFSDIHQKIRWCEDNLETARIISERATLFVHDLLLDRRSEKDNEEVKFQVMERYSKIYG
ncbi:hypothetical protein ACHAXA_006207 [Cyclostephanos tholiformis]|uniref:Glycosyl transferase CAP10 domain-containing protein n=1 Tax=Cyclostephanos tholiformis TaxID=382380 RepID=A0ABD3RRD8_9STRA